MSARAVLLNAICWYLPGGSRDRWARDIDAAIAEAVEQERARWLGSFLELVDVAEEAASYTPDYFNDKWNITERITELRRRMTGGGE